MESQPVRVVWGGTVSALMRTQPLNDPEEGVSDEDFEKYRQKLKERLK
jgi:hypothetical protein